MTIIRKRHLAKFQCLLLNQYNARKTVNRIVSSWSCDHQTGTDARLALQYFSLQANYFRAQSGNKRGN